ncbi:hypothetical protein COCON_G00083480 [Conger conger]|uniref:Uncharacterized protein n=1 Tax=Conger conger TaxID=82655 RepID=A0A9Q1DQ90_CONCO|nr:hypothetical protein COCON_G00083480 [Conger conger]
MQKKNINIDLNANMHWWQAEPKPHRAATYDSAPAQPQTHSMTVWRCVGSSDSVAAWAPPTHTPPATPHTFAERTGASFSNYLPSFFSFVYKLLRKPSVSQLAVDFYFPRSDRVMCRNENIL